MKRWTWRLLSSLLTCIVLGSCNTQESSVLDPKFDTEEYLPQFDMQNEFSTWNPLCETEEQIYAIFPALSPFIYYYDKAAQVSGILCGRPECIHQDSSCNAYTMGTGGICLYEDRLWFIESDAKTGEMGLYALNLDGTEREKIQTIEYTGGANTIIRLHRGYLYIGNIISAVSEGTPVYTFSVTRQKLAQEAGQPQVLYEKKSAATPNYRYILVGNSLFLYCQIDHEDGRRLELYQYNLQTGEGKVLYQGESASFWAYGMGYAEDKIYVFEGTDADMTATPEAYTSRLLRYDLNGQTMEAIQEQNHPFLYGQFEMGTNGVYSRLEYSQANGTLSLDLQDISGEILREEEIPVANDMRIYRVWGCYGVTEKGALYWLEWDNLTGNSRIGTGLLWLPIRAEEDPQWLLELHM